MLNADRETGNDDVFPEKAVLCNVCNCMLLLAICIVYTNAYYSGLVIMSSKKLFIPACIYPKLYSI